MTATLDWANVAIYEHFASGHREQKVCLIQRLRAVEPYFREETLVKLDVVVETGNVDAMDWHWVKRS